ncbi:hypothetical protein BOVAB4_2093 [Bacteroides ovatus]|nr:hypothetical protein BOVA514_3699 [Bacteroides ovatus]CAG9911766.1 hypothetical protein BOVAB4_2093 [Bacteroides ovatus]
MNYPCKDSGFSAENQRYAPIQFSKLMLHTLKKGEFIS